MATLIEHVDSLRAEVQQDQKRLRQDYENLETTLEDKIDQTQKNIEDQRNQYAEEVKKVTKLQETVTALEMVRNRQEAEIGTLQESVRELKMRVAEPIQRVVDGQITWPGGPPGLQNAISPAAGPAEPAQMSGPMVVVKWMPQCNGYKAPQNAWQQKPPPSGVCEHLMEDWFCLPLEPSASWKGAQNVPDDEDPNWSQNNHLQSMCTSFGQVSEMKYFGGTTTRIYECMMARRSMCMEWHNTQSSGYYVRFGCLTCGSCTPKYQPQMVGQFWYQSKSKNDPTIKASFRAFASRIFNDQALEETDQMQ